MCVVCAHKKRSFHGRTGVLPWAGRMMDGCGYGEDIARDVTINSNWYGMIVGLIICIRLCVHDEPQPLCTRSQENMRAREKEPGEKWREQALATATPTVGVLERATVHLPFRTPTVGVSHSRQRSNNSSRASAAKKQRKPRWSFTTRQRLTMKSGRYRLSKWRHSGA
eukprot:scaffold52406_cov48-Attheya_sp.AAC.1